MNRYSISHQKIEEMKQIIYTLLFFICVTAYSQAQDAGITLRGKVIDQLSGVPLSYSLIEVINSESSATAGRNGRFVVKHLPTGNTILKISRIGYQTKQLELKLSKADTLVIKLIPSAINLNELIVTNKQKFIGGNIQGSSMKLSNRKLQENLSSTLASTIEKLPGISTRSMGAAPSRPVIRGLGGKRVMIMQDGIPTGDASAQSADHAVTIDPISAQKVEIARGPETLQYGSNTIGGIVNVVSNQIPATLPDHIQGGASLQGSTSDLGGAAALELKVPIKDIAIQLNSAVRAGNNIYTPVGRIDNTSLFNTDQSLGLSYIHPHGYVGGAVSYYLNNYGIPPDPEGGHKNGVDIQMRSLQLKGKSEILLGKSFIHSVMLDYAYTNYYHEEIEPGGIIGTEIGQLSTSIDAAIHHKKWAFIDKGTIGIDFQSRNLAIQGAETPTSNSYDYALYIIEQSDFRHFHAKAGARFDYVSILPEKSDTSSSIGRITMRTFPGLSASFSLSYDLSKKLTIGTEFMYSFRAPTPIELYSEGPHLASYSYEVGNPGLDAERALGKELYIAFQNTNIYTKLSLYHNSFGNYIFPMNTGKTSIRFPNLLVYQYSDGAATFYGTEFTLHATIQEHFGISTSMSYTHAALKVKPSEQDKYGKRRPLPMIPPLEGNIGIRYENKGFTIALSGRMAAAQRRTGLFETPTPGYTVMDFNAQYQLKTGHLVHTLSLEIRNVFNQVYYNHLSRIKELFPEPGRNISLFYRLYF